MFKKLATLTTASFALASCVGQNSNGTSTNANTQAPSMTKQSIQSPTMPTLIQMNKDKILSNAMLTNIQNRRKTLGSASEPAVRVAYGFDSRTGMSDGYSCLANSDDPNSITLSNPQGSINFSDNISTSEVSNLLNANIQGNSNFGLFSASIAASYVRNTTDSRQSLNFNYLQSMGADATFKLNGLGNSILSTDAKNLLTEGMNQFTSVCGDSIILGAKEGAVLAVNVSIKFANAASKEKFEGSAKGSIAGIGSISGAFKNEQNSSTKNASFSVRAYQLGGDPTQLAKIFGNPNPQGQYNVVRCNADNITACENIINDVVGYAQKDFETKVDFKNPNTLYTYEYNVRPYTRLGVQAYLPTLTPEELQAKDYLSSSIEHDRELFTYLKAYQNQSFYSAYVNNVSKHYLDQAIKDYTKMISEYNNYSIIDACYGDTQNINTRCINTANQIKDMRDEYKNSINRANNFAGAIEATTPIGETIFIPTNGQIINSNSVIGSYIAYNTSINQYSTRCLMDTTPDNHFFKQSYPQYINRSVYCFGEIIPGVDDFYVYRVDNLRFGHAGHIVNGAEITYPIPAQGYNVQFFYPDNHSLLEFNPI